MTTRRLLGLIALLAGSGVAAWPVAAQQITVEPSAAAGCLKSIDSKSVEPEYPFAQYKLSKPGRVKVELDFDGPDRRPSVKVLEQEGDEEFVDAVKAYARTLRVACLAEGSTARLHQDYVFNRQGEPVHWGPPEDPQRAARAAQFGCMRHQSGQKSPDYPRRALSEGLQSRVVVVLHFDAADKPPQARVMSRPYANQLAAHVEDWVKGLRMPCHQGEPVKGSTVFSFTFKGEGYGFPPLTLQQWIGSTKGVSEQRLQLDTTTMGCPFVARLVYRQPNLPNAVASVGAYNPARRPLFEWLASVELDLPGKALDSVYGDTADITVPCLKIDIKPKEKS